MQHTLVAVFDNRVDAQKALEDLVAGGFSRQMTRLSEGDPAGQARAQSTSSGTTGSSASAHDGSIGSSIKEFFSDMFGSDRSDDAHMYSNAVSGGHYVLTVTADSEREVERAADIVERYGPVDIDEHAEQWGAGASGTQGTMRSGAGTMQQSVGTQQSAATPKTGKGVSSQSLQGANMQGSIVQGSNKQTLQGQDSQQRAADTQSIPIVQEELHVGKREVQRGGVRVYQRVVETPVNETVGLREEHVSVERHATDRPVSPGDVNAFQETTIELRESAEEAVVEKTARVVEEVVIGKEVTQRQEKISDTVRRTEVDVEQLSPEDDAYFRSHWTSNYGPARGAYDQYAPAYSYGSTMARSQQYRGRQWDEVEGTLRTDWETRNPGSTWENMKAAVRHGWERMTS